MDKSITDKKNRLAAAAEKEKIVYHPPPFPSAEGFFTSSGEEFDHAAVPPSLRAVHPNKETQRRARDHQAKLVAQHEQRFAHIGGTMHDMRFGDTAAELRHSVADVERLDRMSAPFPWAPKNKGTKPVPEPVVKESKALRNLQYMLLEADVENIEKKSIDNNYFRHVLYTSKNMQLVVMSLKPGEDIGEEAHKDTDQFFRIEEGSGKAVIEGKTYSIKSGTSVLVPKGTKHNIKNTSDKFLKLYTIYSPPKHKDGLVNKTKKEAEIK